MKWTGHGFEDVCSTADNESVKRVSILFAVLAAVGASLAALLCLAGVSIAGDHRPTTGGPYLLAAAVMATAFFAWRAVRSISSGQPDSARSALIIYAALGGVLLLFGLHASTHSDGRLLAYGLGNEVCAFIAFMLMPADAHPQAQLP